MYNCSYENTPEDAKTISVTIIAKGEYVRTNEEKLTHRPEKNIHTPICTIP